MSELTQLAVVTEARRWIGTPYRHQGSAIGAGCDCLGLVRGVWRALYGDEPEPPPAYRSSWAEGGGQETLYDAARRHLVERALPWRTPGDVLLFRWKPLLPMKHAAILVARDRIIHAYDAAGKVVESPLDPSWVKRLAGCFAFPPREEGRLDQSALCGTAETERGGS